MKIKSIIVEDVIAAADNLFQLLKPFNNIEIISACTTHEDAVTKINYFKPNLLFMDIEIGSHSGFDILDACIGNFKYVIFTTSHDEFALKAFEYNTIHYILKPVNSENLQLAIDKISNSITNNLCYQSDFEILKENIQISKGINSNKLFYFEKNEYLSIDIPTIKYIKGDSAFSNIILKNNENIRIFRSLKYIEQLLSKHPAFVRIHKSYLINIHFISKIRKGQFSIAILEGDIEIPISINAKENLFTLLGL